MGAFEKNVPCGCRNTRFYPPEDSCNAHSFFFIADHQVARIKVSFMPVECNESGFVRKVFNYYFLPGYFIRVKSMQWLPYLVLNEVGYVHNIVYGV